MKQVLNIFDRTKKQPIDVWFFFLFLLTFTFSIRKVLFYFPIRGNFNEYSGIYLYLSDIFLISAIGAWLFSILCNNKITLSNLKLWIKNYGKNGLLLFPLLLVFWSFISIAWSRNQSIAIFRSLKLLEFLLLYLYLIFRFSPKLFHLPCRQAGVEQFQNVSFQRILNCSTWNNFFLVMILVAILQSVVGIIQFLFHRSLGLRFVMESVLSPAIPGVAKIILGGEKYIRAYGFFPHPNILAGVLVLSLVLSLFLLNCSTWNILRGEAMTLKSSQSRFYFFSKKLPVKKSSFIWAIFLIQIFGLLLSFSKSAMLGLFVALAYLFHPEKSKNVPRGTFLDCGAGVEHFEKDESKQRGKSRTVLGIVLFCFGAILFLFAIKINLHAFLIAPLKERIFYTNVPRGTIFEEPILGVGMGQSVLIMQDYFQKVLEPFEYQPVHNVFLLIWSELGVVGVVLFILFIWRLFCSQKDKIVPRGTIPDYSNQKNFELFHLPRRQAGVEQFYLIWDILTAHLRAALLAFVVIMLFDHYFWDIQQGQVMFWLVSGLLAGLSRK